MQNRDGGWASFDRGNDKTVADPGAVRRSQRDDRSQHRRHHRPRARVSELLPGLRAPRIRWSRARCSFLRRDQNRDGAWYGRWGVNYIYGTWQVLRGLACIGEDMTRPTSAAPWAGCSRTRTATAAGARASPATRIPSQAGVGASTPSQTAWAVMGLVAAGEERSTAVRNGVRHLLERQDADGTWARDGVDGHRLSQGLLSPVPPLPAHVPADGAGPVPARRRGIGASLMAGAARSPRRRKRVRQGAGLPIFPLAPKAIVIGLLIAWVRAQGRAPAALDRAGPRRRQRARSPASA